MSVLHMLDTDTASYLVKGRVPVLEQRISELDPSSVCVSVVTRAEMMYGLKRLAPEHKLHTAVRRFLKLVRVLPWDADAADFYADIRRHLKEGGNPIGEVNMMIAAHALSAGAVLITNNTRHFERIRAPLIVRNWTVTAAG